VILGVVHDFKTEAGGAAQAAWILATVRGPEPVSDAAALVFAALLFVSM